jgi:hypothetical protein
LESVTLRDIEAIARLESAKMQNFYVGVEHLFIALTKLDGSLTATIFEQHGQSARYLRYATRELAGRGDDRRYWPGYRVSPRATEVMSRAQALIDSGLQPDERALLMAILEEGDSIPIRALREAGVEIRDLIDAVRSWTGEIRTIAPQVEILGGEKLSAQEALVLQQMFKKYERVQIEHLFQEGFSGSTVMLVRPINADGRSDALVVVKIADRQSILWEKKRYDSFVKDTLPPTTARIEAEPTLPDTAELGGLKYTFVRLRGEDSPTNLYEYATTSDPAEVARFIHEAVYNGFREAWWGQAQPYRFTAWHEYDFLLPPTLIVEAVPSDGTMGATPTRPVRPLDEWNRTGDVHPGEMLELENFTVQKVKRSAGLIQVAAGAAPEAVNRASRIDVQGIDFSAKAYFRGELVKKIAARVIQTRDDILQQQVQALEPNFNIMEEHLPFGSTASSAERIPNPLRRYKRVLDLRITGTLSTIHGDLHTGNILIGPAGDAWLIDFEWTRDGHTLFDWAVLETSLLIDHVMPSVGREWDDVWRAIRLLDTLNRKGGPEQVESDRGPMAQAFRPIVEVRRIVSELLAMRDSWLEYQVALALCGLRVIGWMNRPLTARRLAFLASALAMSATRDRSQTHTVGDLTDVTTAD